MSFDRPSGRLRSSDERDRGAADQRDPRAVDEADQQPLRSCVSFECDEERENGRKNSRTDYRGAPR